MPIHLDVEPIDPARAEDLLDEMVTQIRSAADPYPFCRQLYGEYLGTVEPFYTVGNLLGPDGREKWSLASRDRRAALTLEAARVAFGIPDSLAALRLRVFGDEG